MFKRAREFRLDCGTFRKQGHSARRKVPPGIPQKSVKRRDRAGRDHVGAERRKGFDPLRKDIRINAQPMGRSGEECRLALIAFHKSHAKAGLCFCREDGDDQTGKSSSGAEVCPMGDGWGRHLEDLGGIGKMPWPEDAERSRGDQVYLWVPFPDERLV